MPFQTGTSGDDNMEADGDFTHYNDYILGYDGDDTIYGGGGTDILNGGGGNDTFKVYSNDTSHDDMDGGSGFDTVVVDVKGYAPGLTYTATLGSSNNVEQFWNAHSWKKVIIGADNFTDMYEYTHVYFGAGGYGGIQGDSANNVIFGFDMAYDTYNDPLLLNGKIAIADEIYGYGGNDKLYGYAGDDTLDGGTGNDTLKGGVGDDELTGGAGADVFVFNDYDNEGADTITDFEDGVDTIKIYTDSGLTFSDLTINDLGSAGTEITWGDGTTITLEGVDHTLIDSSDFAFI